MMPSFLLFCTFCAPHSRASDKKDFYDAVFLIVRRLSASAVKGFLYLDLFVVHNCDVLARLLFRSGGHGFTDYADHTDIKDHMNIKCHIFSTYDMHCITMVGAKLGIGFCHSTYHCRDDG